MIKNSNKIFHRIYPINSSEEISYLVYGLDKFLSEQLGYKEIFPYIGTKKFEGDEHIFIETRFDDEHDNLKSQHLDLAFYVETNKDKPKEFEVLAVYEGGKLNCFNQFFDARHMNFKVEDSKRFLIQKVYIHTNPILFQDLFKNLTRKEAMEKFNYLKSIINI